MNYSYCHLLVITGYSYGIIHSINGVFLVLIAGLSGLNCTIIFMFFLKQLKIPWASPCSNVVVEVDLFVSQISRYICSALRIDWYYIYVHIYICTYIYMYIYIYTFIHLYIYVYTSLHFCKWVLYIYTYTVTHCSTYASCIHFPQLHSPSFCRWVPRWPWRSSPTLRKARWEVP